MADIYPSWKTLLMVALFVLMETDCTENPALTNHVQMLSPKLTEDVSLVCTTERLKAETVHSFYALYLSNANRNASLATMDSAGNSEPSKFLTSRYSPNRFYISGNITKGKSPSMWLAVTLVGFDFADFGYYECVTFYEPKDDKKASVKWSESLERIQFFPASLSDKSEKHNGSRVNVERGLDLTCVYNLKYSQTFRNGVLSIRSCEHDELLMAAIYNKSSSNVTYCSPKIICAPVLRVGMSLVIHTHLFGVTNVTSYKCIAYSTDNESKAPVESQCVSLVDNGRECVCTPSLVRLVFPSIGGFTGGAVSFSLLALLGYHIRKKNKQSHTYQIAN